eukprot:TRINITY_DN22289_c0_g1_i1.p1 TRINITY_DN22289_c0_g1~~TRINITY_DN22289_c0_g1_i1.p1  ORF type:complete len:320 (+),score=49.54 TRINITY_DN22289_c0_g1_i1:68-1027(+)
MNTAFIATFAVLAHGNCPINSTDVSLLQINANLQRTKAIKRVESDMEAVSEAQSEEEGKVESEVDEAAAACEKIDGFTGPFMGKTIGGYDNFGESTKNSNHVNNPPLSCVAAMQKCKNTKICHGITCVGGQPLKTQRCTMRTEKFLARAAGGTGLSFRKASLQSWPSNLLATANAAGYTRHNWYQVTGNLEEKGGQLATTIADVGGARSPPVYNFADAIKRCNAWPKNCNEGKMCSKRECTGVTCMFGTNKCRLAFFEQIEPAATGDISFSKNSWGPKTSMPSWAREGMGDPRVAKKVQKWSFRNGKKLITGTFGGAAR